jgi:dipeptidyl aminopeptidase/acylaminoacyl peptidase
VRTLPHGSWPSPITASSLARGQAGLDEVRIDGTDTYWLESRPWESGRVVLVRHRGDTGGREDAVQAPFNVRSRVHEYGGGAYAVHEGTVVFSHFADNRLYRSAPGEAPSPITPEDAVRYAGLVLTKDTLLAVREDHRAGGEPVNELVRLDPSGPNDDLGQVLVAGPDFVSRPAVAADGSQLAWAQWDHPNMPWDSTTLLRARLTEAGLVDVRTVAGGEGISVSQPQFGVDGTLWFVSDESGYWNLNRDDEQGTRAVHTLDADIASPQWVLGLSDYAVIRDDAVLIRFWREGTARLAVLAPRDGTLVELDRPESGFDQLVTDGTEVALRTASASDHPQVVRGAVTPDGALDARVLATASETAPDPAYLSTPQPWSWTNSAGLDAHGFVYPPVNADASAPEGDLPPLLVLVHGGPTSHSEPVHKAQTQYWTSRGFLVLDVNHGGGTAYGRAYRERLKGQWGIVDIDDVVSGVGSLADAGLVDRDRVVIRGGSAGGYTVLRALTASHVFTAGTSYFGISDLAALLVDDHKFESRYTTTLVGPWPEAEAVYRDRSPVHHIADMHGDVLLLQGADDLVVPVAQAQLMADAMRAAGKQVELVVYEGEGHGFRRASTIIDSLERELAFYLGVFDRSRPSS